MNKENSLGNENLEKAIMELNEKKDKDTTFAVINEFRKRMNENGKLLVPVEHPGKKVGEYTSNESKLFMKKLRLNNGEEMVVAFTNRDEAGKGQPTLVVSSLIESFLQGVLSMPGIAGAVINPFGKEIFLPKSIISLILFKPYHVSQSRIFFEQGDITQLNCECIVNAANNTLLGGGGVDGAIHKAAGPGLLEECRALKGCRTGEAKITKGYNLKAKYVIHTVGPIYSGSDKDRKLLESCYTNSLELAKAHHIHSIAFPSISTGAYGYPIKEAIPIAILTITKWLQANEDYRISVIISCFDRNTYGLYKSFISYCREQNADKIKRKPIK